MNKKVTIFLFSSLFFLMGCRPTTTPSPTSSIPTFTETVANQSTPTASVELLSSPTAESASATPICLGEQYYFNYRDAIYRESNHLERLAGTENAQFLTPSKIKMDIVLSGLKSYYHVRTEVLDITIGEREELPPEQFSPPMGMPKVLDMSGGAWPDMRPEGFPTATPDDGTYISYAILDYSPELDWYFVQIELKEAFTFSLVNRNGNQLVLHGYPRWTWLPKQKLFVYVLPGPEGPGLYYQLYDLQDEPVLLSRSSEVHKTFRWSHDFVASEKQVIFLGQSPENHFSYGDQWYLYDKEKPVSETSLVALPYDETTQFVRDAKTDSFWTITEHGDEVVVENFLTKEKMVIPRSRFVITSPQGERLGDMMNQSHSGGVNGIFISSDKSQVGFTSGSGLLTIFDCSVP